MRFLFALLVGTTLVSEVNAEGFGAWSTDVTHDREAIYAATVNDSGNLLGQYCFPEKGNCIWLLGMSAACHEGDEYAVLANSDAGAAHISVYCSAQLEGGLYRYVFSDFDAVDKIVKGGMQVGFAVPLQSDNFQVVRFDLSGAKHAIDLLRAAAEKAAQYKTTPTKPKGTKDQYL